MRTEFLPPQTCEIHCEDLHLGAGGREHALAWAADRFGHEVVVVVVPGKAGNPWSSTTEPSNVDLYVLGSDAVVCSGQGDRLRQHDTWSLDRTPAEAARDKITSNPRFADRMAVTVVLASEGYPGKTRVGDVIEGLSAARSLADVEIFAAASVRARRRPVAAS